MVWMNVSNHDVGHLIESETRWLQAPRKLAQFLSEKSSGAGVDEDQSSIQLYQERIDRSFDGRFDVCLGQQSFHLTWLGIGQLIEHLEPFRPIGKSKDIDSSYLHPAEPGSVLVEFV